MRDDARVSDADIDDRVDLEGFRSVFADAAVQYAVLFGSYATESETVTSDLDICVRFPDEFSRRERFRWRNRIDSALQSYAEPFVDVSDLETLPETVALNALRDGQLLYGNHETKVTDEQRLERQVDASSKERERRRREFIDRLAKGDV